MKKLILTIFIGFMLASCSKDGAADNSAVAQSGKAGSLARFAIVGNYLYVADVSLLKVYNIANNQPMELANQVYINGIGMVETIFPFKGKLFIGSTAGINLYNIEDPTNPQLVGMATHLRSCDPVVANDSIAFVSLQGNTRCGPAQDGLYIHRIDTSLNMALVKQMNISTPKGLGLEQHILYLCRQAAGMDVLDVSNPANPTIIKTITGHNFQDVIPYNGILICQVENGLALYDINDIENPVFIKDVLN